MTGSAGITEIAYVCTPNHWEHALFTSMRSLLASGSSFDRLVVYCVGRTPRHWSVADPRISFEEVRPLMSDYFLSNKAWICESDAERVIFLDADTLVLRSIDEVWRGRDEDFIGRPASQYRSHTWDEAYWQEVSRRAGAGPAPYFNAGFFIFQNGAQRRLGFVWKDFMKAGRSGELFDPARVHKKVNLEQIALSLAVPASGCRWAEMSAEDHGFGWRSDPWRRARVYHTGNTKFPRYAALIEPRMGLSGRALPELRQGGLSNPIVRGRLKRRFLQRPLFEITQRALLSGRSD